LQVLETHTNWITSIFLLSCALLRSETICVFLTESINSKYIYIGISLYIQSLHM
jgi:hypothetical protein